MKNALIAVGVVIAAIVLTVVTSYITAFNKGVGFESNIAKYHDSSKNTLSAYTLSIQEMAQVPEMYIDDLERVIQATFEGRYGADGSQAMFQWIQEQNLQVDSSLYTQIQTTMRSGREEFRIAQDRKIDACRDYEFASRSFWTGTFMGMAGFNYRNMASECVIVLDQRTIDTFDTGIAEPITL